MALQRRARHRNAVSGLEIQAVDRVLMGLESIAAQGIAMQSSAAQRKATQRSARQRIETRSGS
jgi:hypothetical protein